VFVYLIEGTRDDSGTLTDVIPDPSGGLIADIGTALSAEDVRPLTDHVTVKAPEFVDFDAIATYYIARSRAKQATQIQAAVATAWAAWLLWQQSSIGRDINPDQGIAQVLDAGAKRIVFVTPSFTALSRDESARASYIELIYGGIEDD
jgi:phage-related baseplate assembly protein